MVFRLVGIFFVVMAFYSLGAVAGSRPRSIRPESALAPNFFDVATVLLCWVAAIAAFLSGYRTTEAIIIGPGLGLLGAFTVYRFLKQNQGAKLTIGNTSGKIQTGIESSSPTAFEPQTQIRRNWMSLARQVGRFQSGLLLSVFYSIALMPFGILVGNFGDPLRLKAPPGNSFWINRDDDTQDLEAAHRQS